MAQLEVKIKRDMHVLALEPDTIAQIQIEAQEKEQQGVVRIYKWGELKKKIPKKLKLSPLVMIPHKSRKYRAILSLSFGLKVD